MNRKAHLYMGIMLLIIGTVLVSIPIVQVLPEVKETAAVSLFDRLGITGGYEQELQTGEYITVVDEKSGAVIDKTARVVYVGDEIIDENNDHYRVNRVRGDKAFARKIGKATDIVWKEEWETAPAAARAVPGNMGKTQVAIYHTHSDESYVPTDGSANIPARGGIFKVGSSLAQEFKAKGVSVVDDKTPHEPHDANAYHRSRKTAVKLMQKKPIALLDVHRDGVPDPAFYWKQLQGEQITKVRLVVGRQNPNMATNLQFAKTVKAYMDKHKPGLIKGIFIGHGDYNQDLSPRALLLEVGTHTNDRYSAQRGAALFADAFPGVLNIKPAAASGGGPGKTTPYGASTGEKRSAWSTAGWIIGIVLVAGAVFLFVSTGSIQGMKSKISELRKTEFANFFGLKKTGRKQSKNNK